MIIIREIPSRNFWEIPQSILFRISQEYYLVIFKDKQRNYVRNYIRNFFKDSSRYFSRKSFRILSGDFSIDFSRTSSNSPVKNFFINLIRNFYQHVYRNYSEIAIEMPSVILRDFSRKSLCPSILPAIFPKVSPLKCWTKFVRCFQSKF